MTRIWRAALALLPLVLTGAADAQTWPERPIRAFIPFSAGSATDVIPRTVFEPLSAELGQPIVVENRGGAGGTIGVGAVVSASPTATQFSPIPRPTRLRRGSSPTCPTMSRLICGPSFRLARTPIFWWSRRRKAGTRCRNWSLPPKPSRARSTTARPASGPRPTSAPNGCASLQNSRRPIFPTKAARKRSPTYGRPH